MLPPSFTYRRVGFKNEPKIISPVGFEKIKYCKAGPKMVNTMILNFTNDPIVQLKAHMATFKPVFYTKVQNFLVNC